MATVTDVEVANASFPNVRQDLNDILEAIATNFSADAEPTTTYPNQWWYETDTNKLYIRNEDNDAWIHVLTLDQTTDTIASVEGAGGDKIEEGNSSVEVIDTGTGYVQINVDGAEVARLDATGLGIGTTSPAADLHVEGTIKLDGNYPVGTNNVALGDTALDDGSLTGNNNTALGKATLTANTSGGENTAVGTNALQSNTTASNNTAVGTNALQVNTTGYDNTAVGKDSLPLNTTGLSNTALGKNALRKSTTASNNTAVGASALNENTTASDNTAVGYNALFANTTGNQNTALGRAALVSNTTASNNTSIGYHSSYQNTTGANNTAVGWSALNSNTTGIGNTVMGYASADAITTGTENTIIGYTAGTNATTGNQNCFVGAGAGGSVTTGGKNTIIGGYSGNSGGLDIRTSSNNIVLSDGDGNVRAYANSGTGWLIGTTNNSPAESATEEGVRLAYNGASHFSHNGDVLLINRTQSDGGMVQFRQAGTQEGEIRVSGTTVSYNGGHLARWSRLADDSKDTSIVKGTVMTNLDAMVEWGDEDNEQLNKMAVSSVEGDANVAGVFVNWDEDDDWNDMNIAMTGDMVIRIAQGTTVLRGDLLMSAGDGTAKPQDDDIVRSKTIAKVTSTHVSHTYDDGSYLVPCVLMAC